MTQSTQFSSRMTLPAAGILSTTESERSGIAAEDKASVYMAVHCKIVQ